jgi:acylphosphatase
MEKANQKASRRGSGPARLGRGQNCPFALPAAGSKFSLFPMPEVPHATVRFQGHVQGVGFRYGVLQVAREFEVAGYVQNLDDGRVLVEAEGAVAEVEAFVAAIEDKMRGHIRGTERALARRPAQFQGFAIR